MAVKYVCKNCGKELFVYKYGNHHGIYTPSEVKRAIGGRCPYCGHELETPSEADITFMPRFRVKRAQTTTTL